jgi:hypothetical protein
LPPYRSVVIPWFKPVAQRFIFEDWLAITIGPLIISWRDLHPAELAHELQHVRQWRKYGLTYIPRYFAASAAAEKAGKDRYWENAFEVEARAAALRVLRSNAAAFVDSVARAGAPSPTHDVFISHASEDKDGFVRPLAHALRELGLNVWYDEFELRVGDSLRREIDRGLASSRFGVVVLSPAFFEQNWPQYELDGLVTREVAAGQQLILPIWHNVTSADVRRYSPSLADTVALRTDRGTVKSIAAEIADVVRDPERPRVRRH